MAFKSWRSYTFILTISSVVVGIGLVLCFADVIDPLGFALVACLAAFAAIPFLTLLGCLYRVMTPSREWPPSLYDKMGPTLTVLLATSIGFLGVGMILFLVFILKIWPTTSTF